MSNDGDRGAPRAPSGAWTLLWAAIGVIAFAVVMVSESGDLFKDLTAKRAQPAWARQAHAQIAADLSVIAVFDVRDQIAARVNDCDYRFFVFCRTWEDECRDAGQTGLNFGFCVATHGGRQRPPTPSERSLSQAVAHAPSVVAMALGTLQTLAQFPDAASQMLKDRWQVSAVDFWTGALFVLVYLTLIIGALRLPGSMKFWGFMVAVILGLDITYGFFWLLLHALAGAGDKAVDVAAMGVVGVGMPVCLGICVGHTTHSFFEAIVRLARLVGLGALFARG